MADLNDPNRPTVEDRMEDVVDTLRGNTARVMSYAQESVETLSRDKADAQVMANALALKADATAVSQALTQYMPKSGGEISAPNGQLRSALWGANGGLVLSGARGGVAGNPETSAGAQLALNSNDASAAGYFGLYSTDGVNYFGLEGTTRGELSWTGAASGNLGRWAAFDPMSFISLAEGPEYRLALRSGAYYTTNNEVSPDNGPWYGFGFDASHFGGNLGLYFGAYGGFKFYSAGDAFFSARVHAGDFFATSDARLKDNIASRVIPLQDLATVLPKSWDWKDGRGHSSGAIAQEIEAILPELVHADAEGMLSVSEGKAALVIALSLAQHLKDANARIAALEAKLAEVR